MCFWTRADAFEKSAGGRAARTAIAAAKSNPAPNRDEPGLKVWFLKPSLYYSGPIALYDDFYGSSPNQDGISDSISSTPIMGSWGHKLTDGSLSLTLHYTPLLCLLYKQQTLG